MLGASEERMKIKKKIEWISPIGVHQAKIVTANILKEGEVEKVQLVYKIKSVLHPTKQYLARRCYGATQSKALIADLEHLLGTDVEQVINLEGEVLPEGLALLKGMEVDIEIDHYQAENYQKPLCLVTKVRKRGELADSDEDLN